MINIYLTILSDFEECQQPHSYLVIDFHQRCNPLVKVRNSLLGSVIKAFSPNLCGGPMGGVYKCMILVNQQLYNKLLRDSEQVSDNSQKQSSIKIHNENIQSVQPFQEEDKTNGNTNRDTSGGVRTGFMSVPDVLPSQTPMEIDSSETSTTTKDDSQVFRHKSEENATQTMKARQSDNFTQMKTPSTDNFTQSEITPKSSVGVQHTSLDDETKRNQIKGHLKSVKTQTKTGGKKESGTQTKTPSQKSTSSQSSNSLADFKFSKVPKSDKKPEPKKELETKPKLKPNINPKTEKNQKQKTVRFKPYSKQEKKSSQSPDSYDNVLQDIVVPSPMRVFNHPEIRDEGKSSTPITPTEFEVTFPPGTKAIKSSGKKNSISSKPSVLASKKRSSFFPTSKRKKFKGELAGKRKSDGRSSRFPEKLPKRTKKYRARISVLTPQEINRGWESSSEDDNE